jgi:hypothetical protein
MEGKPSNSNGHGAERAIRDLTESREPVLVAGTVAEIQPATATHLPIILDDGTGTIVAEAPITLANDLTHDDPKRLLGRLVAARGPVSAKEDRLVIDVAEVFFLHRDVAAAAEALLSELEDAVESPKETVKGRRTGPTQAEKRELRKRGLREAERDAARPPPPMPAPDTGAKRDFWCPNCWDDTLDQKLPTKWVCRRCHKPVPFPPWLARRVGPDLEDVFFSPRTLYEIHNLIRGQADAAKALETAMRERLLPRELTKDLQKALITYRESRPIQIDGTRSIEIREDGIYMVTDTNRGPDARRVLGRPISVLKRVLIEDQELAVVEMKGGVVAGDFTELYSRLKRGSQILDKRMAEDVLALLIDNCNTVTRGFPTFEVISEDGRLFIPAEIYPRDENQAAIVKTLEPHLEDEPDQKGWQDWAGLFGKLNLYEVAPAAALAAISALAPILRRHRIMVPHVLHLSKNPGKGKSLIANAVTHHLWTTKFELAETMESGYRIAAHGDSAAVPMGVDEAQTLNWEKFSGFLKQVAESEDSTSRGQVNGNGLSMKHFKARRTFIFTSNALPGLSQPLTTRFMIVHYDEHRVISEAFLKDLEDLMNRLPVAGPALTRAAMSLCSERETMLVDIIRKEIRPKLQESFKGWVEKGRRPTAWAVLYFGLQVWEKASGGIVRCPTIEEFVRDVIEPVEASTRQAVLDPLTLFQSWMLNYVSANQAAEGHVRGDNILFKYGDEDGRRGWWMTQAMLDRFNRDQKDRPEANIAGLTELANLVSDRFQISLKEFKDAEGKFGLVKKFGPNNRRAIFVPDVEIDGPPQARLTTNGANGNGHAPLGELAQGDRVERLMRILRATAKLAPDGVPEAVLLEHGEIAGLSREHIPADLSTLRERGLVYSPHATDYLPSN